MRGVDCRYLEAKFIGRNEPLTQFLNEFLTCGYLKFHFSAKLSNVKLRITSEASLIFDHSDYCGNNPFRKRSPTMKATYTSKKLESLLFLTF